MKILLSLSLAPEFQLVMPTTLALQFIHLNNMNLLMLLKQKGFDQFNFAIDLKSGNLKESLESLIKLKYKSNIKRNVDFNEDKLNNVQDELKNNIKNGIRKTISINIQDQNIIGKTDRDKYIKQFLYNWIIILVINEQTHSVNIVEKLLYMVAEIDFLNNERDFYIMDNNSIFAFSSSFDENSDIIENALNNSLV